MDFRDEMLSIVQGLVLFRKLDHYGGYPSPGEIVEMDDVDTEFNCHIQKRVLGEQSIPIVSQCF